jgi:hypothetical protein
MTVMNTLSDGRILRSFSRGVVPYPQPGATLFGCGEGRVRVLAVGRYTSQKGPGSSTEGTCGFWGTTPGSSR